MGLRELQAPLKDRYRADPGAARITLGARGTQTDSALSCSVDLGLVLQRAQAHAGTGGAGTAACSGDLLLGALAACAQLTCQMVAEATGVPVVKIETLVEGDLDLRGTLGVDPEVPVGFERIRLRFEIDAPDADEAQLERLLVRTERACTVLQTLLEPPAIETTLARA